MKDALKQEVTITRNIIREIVLLQNPFGGYKWYLEDRCWAQLEHRVVPYDPREKLHCFPSLDVFHSLQAAGWIEAQHYIVGNHVDYDAYWCHVSHGVLMLGIARCGNIDIPDLKLTLDMTLDFEARHLDDKSRIRHLTTSLRHTEYHHSQLNDYLDGEGVLVDWVDDEGEAGTC
ncbi:hypothetical protein GIB67_030983 [Kingdonia uniflora]|uniref:Uncharacterized protein n=1 Tax=Kingdonia uniflora TaxID=39325 RepID=A0A7J7L3R5_9MAGN|nr:hypothetical protein GIB67_030983 [Kingdonia uniflora]